MCSVVAMRLTLVTGRTSVMMDMGREVRRMQEEAQGWREMMNNAWNGRDVERDVQP